MIRIVHFVSGKRSILKSSYMICLQHWESHATVKDIVQTIDRMGLAKEDPADIVSVPLKKSGMRSRESMCQNGHLVVYHQMSKVSCNAKDTLCHIYKGKA